MIKFLFTLLSVLLVPTPTLTATSTLDSNLIFPELKKKIRLEVKKIVREFKHQPEKVKNDILNLFYINHLSLTTPSESSHEIAYKFFSDLSSESKTIFTNIAKLINSSSQTMMDNFVKSLEGKSEKDVESNFFDNIFEKIMDADIEIKFLIYTELYKSLSENEKTSIKLILDENGDFCTIKSKQLPLATPSSLYKKRQMLVEHGLNLLMQQMELFSKAVAENNQA